MRQRPAPLRTLLELVRLPNVFTAPADVAMGLAVSGAPFGGPSLALLLASACAYAGGMALNDAWDAPLDAVERPERPIPSGRITRAAAFTLAGGLLLASVAVAAIAGLRPFWTAVLLALAIAIYDGLAKGSSAGPVSMALCRGLNCGLGIAAGAVSAASIGAAATLFVYVLIITIVSRFEVMAAPVALVRRASLAFAGVIFVAAAVNLGWWGPAGMAGLAFLVLLAGWLAPALRQALAEPSPRRIIMVIKTSVLGIILLDAAFTAAARGVLAGLLVAILFIPAYVLGRRFASA
jgi:4-hydroxybenzoate polyprenyltransferase